MFINLLFHLIQPWYVSSPKKSVSISSYLFLVLFSKGHFLVLWWYPASRAITFFCKMTSNAILSIANTLHRPWRMKMVDQPMVHVSFFMNPLSTSWYHQWMMLFKNGLKRIWQVVAMGSFWCLSNRMILATQYNRICSTFEGQDQWRESQTCTTWRRISILDDTYNHDRDQRTTTGTGRIGTQCTRKLDIVYRIIGACQDGCVWSSTHLGS